MIKFPSPCGNQLEKLEAYCALLCIYLLCLQIITSITTSNHHTKYTSPLKILEVPPGTSRPGQAGSPDSVDPLLPHNRPLLQPPHDLHHHSSLLQRGLHLH